MTPLDELILVSQLAARLFAHADADLADMARTLTPPRGLSPRLMLSAINAERRRRELRVGRGFAQHSEAA